MPSNSPKSNNLDNPISHVLGIFVKEPVAGKVKTRLGREIGDRESAQLYEQFVKDLLARFHCLPEKMILGYSPGNTHTRKWANALVEQHLPAGETGVADQIELWPQPEGELGERIIAYFDHAFKIPGIEAVLLIGSDSPTIPQDYVQQAFEWLYQKDSVIGPTADGGYYLIGLRVACKEIFSGINWSSPNVLEQTVENVKKAGLSLKLLPVWYDIDSKEDLEMLKGHLSAMKIAQEQELPEQTDRWLSRWDAE